MDKKLFLLAVSLLIVTTNLASAQSTSEGAGQAAEQAGKLRDAVTHYTAALQSATEGSDQEQKLKEKIIKLVLQIDPPPAVSDEARRRLIRGRAAVAAASDKDGFLRAATEFKEALRLAPWIAEAYFNLGLLQDKGGDYTSAIRSLKLYLLAAPKAEDVQKVKDQIVEIEYRMEEAQRAGVEAQRKAAEAQAQKQQEWLRSLAGLWRDAQYDGTTYCNQTDIFELIFTGSNTFTLKWVRRDDRPGCSPSAGVHSMISKSIEATLKGRELTVIYTIVNNYSGSGFPSCARRGIATDVYYGQGNINEDGRQMQLSIRYGGFDPGSCRSLLTERPLPLVKVR